MAYDVYLDFVTAKNYQIFEKFLEFSQFIKTKLYPAGKYMLKFKNRNTRKR